MRNSPCGSQGAQWAEPCVPGNGAHLSAPAGPWATWVLSLSSSAERVRHPPTVRFAGAPGPGGVVSWHSHSEKASGQAGLNVPSTLRNFHRQNCCPSDPQLCVQWECKTEPVLRCLPPTASGTPVPGDRVRVGRLGQELGGEPLEGQGSGLVLCCRVAL